MKPVYKPLVKCICFIMPFFILGCFIKQDMLGLVDGEAPYYIWNREKANTTQNKKYRIVILGDSTSNAAYVPEVLSQDTINLALGGTTPVENYYTLHDWLENNQAPDVCYISFGDGHFQIDDCFWTRTMFSHRYSLKQNAEMLGAAIYYRERSILATDSKQDFISSQIYLPKEYLSSVLDGTFEQTYKSNSNAMKLDELHGGRYIARGTKEYNVNEPIVYKEFNVAPIFDEYYKKIIEMCIENGITPRIVKLPLPDNSQFTEDYVNGLYEYYEDLHREYPLLSVDWPTKIYPKNCFVDSVHMNSHGALQFSLELKELYPHDFSSMEVDEAQIAALDDSIRGENKIEWILKWISERDYTVLFYDKQGEFKNMYEGQLKEKWGTCNLHLVRVPVKNVADRSSRKLDVWKISGIENGETVTSLSLVNTDDGISIELKEQDPILWKTISDDMLGVVVLNNYNHKVVCSKSFQYVNEPFQLFS